jgi:tRNA G18 (ribose-2'-O)-methylase SpoU
VRSACERLVSIPIADRVESLNVAVATGILLHAVRP